MTDWESLYRAGDTPWDKGAPAPPLVDWLRASATRPHGEILVPGCGLGHDVRALAEACPNARVLGLDLSPSAILAADAKLTKGKEGYRTGNLFTLQGSFDWIFEHTCFCAIDPAQRGEYATSVARVLKPGGHLLAIFYLNPRDPGEDAIGPPHGVTIEELDGYFDNAFELLEDGVPARSYPGREGRERLRLYRKRTESLRGL